MAFDFDCHCEACEQHLPTEVDMNTFMLYDLYEDIEKKDKVDFKGLIKEYIKPDWNYYSRLTFFEHFFDFNKNNQPSGHRVGLELRHGKRDKIEKGLI